MATSDKPTSHFPFNRCLEQLVSGSLDGLAMVEVRSMMECVCSSPPSAALLVEAFESALRDGSGEPDGESLSQDAAIR